MDSENLNQCQIFCLVLGDAVHKSFPIDIDKGATIGHLKQLIKTAKDSVYNNVDANDIELWCVNIPINMENADVKIYEENIREYGGMGLLPNAVVGTFACDNNNSNIRIIVKPPPITTGIGRKLEGISRLEGLGGTSVEGKEYGKGYEGLDLDNIDGICQRKETINRLLSDLFEKRIILVRSPPMAGKTSLAQLLEYNILHSDEFNNGSRCVFRISLMWMIKRGMEWTFAEGFKMLMKMEWGEFIELCRYSKFETILIIDEVQLIYKPQNEREPRYGGSVFWDTLKEVNQYLSNLCIVAFASYGHYGAYTSYGGHSVMDISPPSILSKDNTWDVPFLRNYVREITAFHPGLVAFTMDEIHRRFVKRSSELEFGDIFAYLKSYEFYSHLKGMRATPQITDMSDDEKSIVDKVLFKKSLEVHITSIPHNSRIIKTNVLVDIGKKENRSILNFPAPLLRATYLQDRFGYVVRSTSPPKAFEDFIKSVFAKMNPKLLQNSKGKGKDGRLFERVWQMEFYRASLQVLPDDIYPSVDVGKVFRSKGYVDFYINDQRNWAIELLRDGIKLNEHRERFHEAGVYSPILKHTKRWAIIDIRNSKMKAPEPEKRELNDIYVLCSETFESVQLLYPNGTKEDVRLLGEENLLGHDISEYLDDSMEIN
ncbi:14412_t:CDS:2 [Gigaspora margarita]|uniref:14412_t:CDS:1 n=1 Tax=Gigaspora margarita TaxID=4874 RepID=A0ABN7V427_GIGMA|nr:14412_t:CDS:2 [Gigaspora margarita]